jgi:hypothetical protein
LAKEAILFYGTAVIDWGFLALKPKLGSDISHLEHPFLYEAIPQVLCLGS